MKTLTLPMLDHDGISDLVLEAKANGATAENIPGDPDNFNLVFEKAVTANAFLKAVEKHKGEVVDDGAVSAEDAVVPTED